MPASTSPPTRAPTALAALLLVLLTLASTALAATPNTPAAAAGTPTTPNALGRYAGAAALWRLGTVKLGHLATRHLLTSPELTTALRLDPTLQLDAADQLLVEDAALGTTTVPVATNVAPLDAGVVPALHTRAGAARTVFVDLAGSTLDQPAPAGWNRWAMGPCTAGPFDLDGDPTAISSSEHDVLADTLDQLGSDLAPFDVDVTTERPPADDLLRSSRQDLRYGTTIVLTSSSACVDGRSLPASVCVSACASIAYLGTFDLLGAARTTAPPALVFTEGIAPSRQDAHTLAETLVHTVGHTLGLLHADCAATRPGCTRYTGHGAWAPIMGDGTDRPLTQWSRGEYPGATNRQDQLAVLAARGFPLLPDDLGDTAAAQPLDLTAGSATTSGVIGTSTDRDAFAFTLTSPVTVHATATPTGLRPDLDLHLELRDATGTPVAVADPPLGLLDADHADGLAAALTVALAPGTYTAVVTGTGDATATTASSYGALGPYLLELAADADPAAVPNAPRVKATASSYGGVAPLSVSLSTTTTTDADGAPLALLWTLPGGRLARTAQTSLTLTTPGWYRITLTGTTADGAQASDSISFLVTDPSNPRLADRTRTTLSEAALAQLQRDTVQDRGAGFRLLTGAGVERDALITITGSPTTTRPAGLALELVTLAPARTTLYVYDATTPALPSTTWATAPPPGELLGRIDVRTSGRISVPLRLEALWERIAAGAPVTLRLKGATLQLASAAQGVPATLALLGTQPVEPTRASTRDAGWAPLTLTRPDPGALVTGLGTLEGRLVWADTSSTASSAWGTSVLRAAPLAVENDPETGPVAVVGTTRPGPLREADTSTGLSTLTVATGGPSPLLTLPTPPGVRLTATGPAATALGLTAPLSSGLGASAPGAARIEDLLVLPAPVPLAARPPAPKAPTAPRTPAAPAALPGRAAAAVSTTELWAAGSQGANAALWRSRDDGATWSRVLVASGCGTAKARFARIVMRAGTVYVQPEDGCATPARWRSVTRRADGSLTVALGPAGQTLCSGTASITHAVTLGTDALVLAGGRLARFDGTTCTELGPADAVTVNASQTLAAVLDAGQVSLFDAAGTRTLLGAPLPVSRQAFVALTTRADGAPVVAVVDRDGTAWRYR